MNKKNMIQSRIKTTRTSIKYNDADSNIVYEAYNLPEKYEEMAENLDELSDDELCQLAMAIQINSMDPIEIRVDNNDCQNLTYEMDGEDHTVSGEFYLNKKENRYEHEVARKSDARRFLITWQTDSIK